MSKWKIELKNIGRGKINHSLEVNADTLPEAENRAIRECQKYLMSDDVGLLDNSDLTYTVTAGYNSVGTVSITST